MHGQRGQATIDYVALLAVLALLLGAATAVAATGAPGVTNAVMSQLRRALCIVTGQACTSHRELPCVVASRRDAKHVAVTIVIIRIDGDRYVLREDLEELTTTTASPAVRLLPGYDQWVLGPGTADAHVVPPARRQLVSRKANLVIAGGVVSGTWSLSGDKVAAAWFAEAGPPPREALAEEVARLATILDRPLQPTVEEA